MDLGNINWLGAIAGAVSAMVLGALWYSPWMFGGRWQELIGRSDEELGNPVVAMLIAAVALHHNLTLVTHNTADYQDIPGLRLDDWLIP